MVVMSLVKNTLPPPQSQNIWNLLNPPALARDVIYRWPPRTIIPIFSHSHWLNCFVVIDYIHHCTVEKYTQKQWGIF